MKRFLLVLVFLIPCLAFTQEDKDAVKVEYDRFKDFTTVTRKPILLFKNTKNDETIEFQLSYVFEGANPKKHPKHMLITTRIETTSPPIFSKEPIFFLADSNRMKAEPFFMSGPTTVVQRPRVFVKIELDTVMLWEEFEKITRAEKLEAKIGLREFEISPEAVKQMNTFFNHHKFSE